MTILSLDRAPFVVAPRTRRRHWLARVIAALYESRMRSAQAVIARHQGFMPRSPDHSGVGPDTRMDPPPRVGRDRRRSRNETA